MKNYVDIAYNPDEKPITPYPDKLATYLFHRYNLSKGMKLLDNGCGRGDFLYAFEKLELEAYGTDAVKGCDRAIITNLNEQKLPFDDNYFDVVFSKSVLEHIENATFYLLEMRRVLKEGGIVILMVPDWQTQYRIFYEDPTHIHPYTKKSIDRILNMTGFTDVCSERFIQLPSVWHNPVLGTISGIIRFFVAPVKRIYKIKFIRFSSELMILGTGRKLTKK